jgi:hypothetical protein
MCRTGFQVITGRAPHEADEQEEDKRADGRADNGGDEAAVRNHLHVDKGPPPHQRAQDADQDIADQAEGRSLDHEACKQSGRGPDGQEDEQGFAEQGAASAAAPAPFEASRL